MDPFIKKMLQDLDLNFLEDHFIEQSIDQSVLLSLDRDELKELIPNIGYRKKISSFIKNSQEKPSDEYNAPPTIENSTISSLIADENGTIVLESTSSIEINQNDTNKHTESQKSCNGIDQNEKYKIAIPLFPGDISLREFLNKSCLGRAMINSFSNKVLMIPLIFPLKCPSE